MQYQNYTAMLHKILTEDWSDYEKRKQGYANTSYIDCTVEWEAEYLVAKTVTAHPYYSYTDVKRAVSSCCRRLPVPYKRDNFVASLMNMLAERGTNIVLGQLHQNFAQPALV